MHKDKVLLGHCVQIHANVLLNNDHHCTVIQHEKR